MSGARGISFYLAPEWSQRQQTSMHPGGVVRGDVAVAGGLAGFDAELLSGDYFLFVNRRRTLCKVLLWLALRDSRSGETAAELLEDYSGWLVTDGLNSYDKAARRSSGVIRQAGCWAHIRRKFIDAESNHPEKCAEILGLIGELYDIEARARDPDKGGDLLEWRAKLREEESKPKLAEIKEWADSQTVLPRSALGKAIRHMQGMWPRLVHFADHPELWIGNNATGARAP